MKKEVAEEIAYSTNGFPLLNEGESMLVKQLNCLPFVDVIRSCQAFLDNISQQIWTCKGCTNNSAIIYCTDEQKHLLYMQNLVNIKMDKSSVQLMVKDGFVTFDIMQSFSSITDAAQLN